MFEFIWDGKPDKLKREISVLNYDNGGLKILDLHHFITSLKSTWIRKYLLGRGKWKYILASEINMPILINCDSINIETTYKTLKNQFWIDVFKAWKSVVDNYKQTEEINAMESPIWHNEKITIGNKTVFYKEWYIKGVRYIQDLVNDDNDFYNYVQFQNAYNIKTDFITFHGILSRVKKIIQQEGIRLPIKSNNPILPLNIRIFLKNRRGANDMYDLLCSNKKKQLPPSVHKWNEIFQFIENEWKIVYSLPFKISKNSKLQWFQTRINHRILGTNWLLNKINNNNNPNCSFCNSEVETIEHIFWECRCTQTFLQHFLQQLGNHNMNINLTMKSFILGQYDIENNKNITNTIILWTKYYIFKTKLNNGNLSLLSFKNHLRKYYHTEKCQRIYEGLAQEFFNDWEVWSTYIES